MVVDRKEVFPEFHSYKSKYSNLISSSLSEYLAFDENNDNFKSKIKKKIQRTYSSNSLDKDSEGSLDWIGKKKN